jgi:hypothetical protein
MLNNAKNALEDEFDWPWLETTDDRRAPLTISDLKRSCTSSTPRTAPSFGPRRPRHRRPRHERQHRRHPVELVAGRQHAATYPTSTTAQLSVRYVRQPGPVGRVGHAADPGRYHPVWIDYAVVEAYKDDDRFNEAQALLNFVRANRLPQIIDAYGDRNRQNPDVQVVVAGSEDW